MGVKMNVLQVNMELLQRNRALSTVQSKMECLETRFQAFGDSTELTGEAYDSHKDYIQNMQLPTASGIKTFCESMIEANRQYISAIAQCFPEETNIEEDKWREEYEQLVSEYDRLNSYLNWVIEALRSIAGVPAKHYVESGQRDVFDAFENLTYIQVSLGEKLEYLKATIELYREKIAKVGEMLVLTADLYSDIAVLQEVIAKAIVQLGVVPISADGTYGTMVVDRIPFQDIKTQQLVMEISRELKLELGDEILTQEQFEKLDSDAQMEYINRIAEVVSKYYPKIAAELGSVTVEIPILPGVSIYTGVAVSANIARTDSPVSVSLAAKNNEEVLGSWGVTVGNVTGRRSQDGVSMKMTYEVNGDTSAYTKIEGDYHGNVKAEWGVETKVDGGTVTTKCGVKAKSSDEYWNEVNLAKYQLPQPNDIKVGGLGILDPSKGGAPGQVPVIPPTGIPTPVPGF